MAVLALCEELVLLRQSLLAYQLHRLLLCRHFRLLGLHVMLCLKPLFLLLFLLLLLQSLLLLEVGLLKHCLELLLCPFDQCIVLRQLCANQQRRGPGRWSLMRWDLH